MMDEKAYLANYDKHAFDLPIVSVDSVLFTFYQDSLKVLLVKRANHPDLGKWGLPGGFVDSKCDGSIHETATRVLAEKTGVIPPYLEQLETFGNAERDKRGWSITVCYTAMMAYQSCEPHISSVMDAEWVDLEQLGDYALAFDHDQLVQEARQRLKQKALYSLVPVYALAEPFTLPELQRIHEVLIGKPLQKKSFRRRIEQSELLIDTGEKRAEGGRPASLYRLKPDVDQYTFVRNLAE